MLTCEEIEQCRKIHEAMTPGEWSYEVVAGLKNRPALMIRNRPSLWKDAKYFMAPNDARGFAHLHNIMPRLLAMAERAAAIAPHLDALLEVARKCGWSEVSNRPAHLFIEDKLAERAIVPPDVREAIATV